MARSNRREAIFFDDDDRCAFLKTLGEACAMRRLSHPAERFARIHCFVRQ